MNLVGKGIKTWIRTVGVGGASRGGVDRKET